DRVDAAHHRADRAVLARGVEGLEDQEHAVAIVRVEPLLDLRHLLDRVRELLDVVRLARIVLGLGPRVLDAKRAVVRHEVRAVDRIEQDRLGHGFHHTGRSPPPRRRGLTNLRRCLCNPEPTRYGAPEMATTTLQPEPAKPERIAYPEDDKLGPLGIRATALHDPIELRARLIGEFEHAVSAAKAAAALADQGSTGAVHEARKALRRARAVLSMVAGALPKSERRAVRAALQ